MPTSVAGTSDSNRFNPREAVGSGEQLALGTVVRDTFGSAGDRLLSVIAEVVVASGKVTDDLATDVGVDPGQFSRALRGRGIHFSVRWLPALIYRDHQHVLIRHLCSLAGGEFTPTPKRTRADENEVIRRYLEERAGEMGDDTIRKALGDDS